MKKLTTLLLWVILAFNSSCSTPASLLAGEKPTEPVFLPLPGHFQHWRMLDSVVVHDFLSTSILETIYVADVVVKAASQRSVEGKFISNKGDVYAFSNRFEVVNGRVDFSVETLCLIQESGIICFEAVRSTAPLFDSVTGISIAANSAEVDMFRDLASQAKWIEFTFSRN